MKRFIGYTVLGLWAAATSALQLMGLALAPALEKGGASVVRAAVPDLTTVLLVAAVGRLARRDVVRLSIAVAVGRAGFTDAPPFAVVAGCIGVGMVADSMRRFAEVGRPTLRVASACAGALLYGAWLIFVDLVRAGEARAGAGAGPGSAFGFGGIDAGDLSLSIVTAASSALVALIAWPVLTGLPGLGQLERRAF